MQIAFVLRDFKDVEPINIFFKFPVHYVDTSGLLEGALVEGDPKANIQNTNKKTEADKRQIIEDAFNAVKRLTPEMDQWSVRIASVKSVVLPSFR